MPIDFKRMLIDPSDSLSIATQCKFLELPKSSFYFVPTLPFSGELSLVNRVDEIYTRYPFYGSRRILHELLLEGHKVGRDKVRSIMTVLGLHAIYPKKNLSKPSPNHRIFPYLLRGKTIDRPNQVWSADITYVRLADGFIYLFAIIDWYSPLVISWNLGHSLNVDFCVEALIDSFSVATPELFNVDQRSQFSSPCFYEPILDLGIKFSMDERGRYLDNIFVERLWRTVNYENVFISGYSNFDDANNGLSEYFDFYNIARPHQSLQKLIPLMAYTGYLN